MNFIILGDKYQKRMKSKGCVGLIKSNNNKNILQNQYRVVHKSFPGANIIYVYGFEGKRFSSYVEKESNTFKNLKILHNDNYEKYNYAYSLSIAEKYLTDNCFIIFGDNPLNTDIFNNFKTSNGSQIFINNKIKNKLGCIINNNKVENISYDLDNYLSEIYYLSKDASLKLKELINNPSHYNYFIFELINKLIDLNCDISPSHIEQKNHQSLIKK